MTPECEATQDVLSAAVDGEASELELRRARVHMRGCPTCAAFDRSSRAGVGPTGPPRPTLEIQQPAFALVAAGLIIAAVNVVVGLPQLLGHNIIPIASPTTVHLARDGALALVTGAIVGTAALRPRWARPLSILGLFVLAIQTLASTADLRADNAAPAFEATHALAVVAVGVTAWLAAVTKPRLVPGPRPTT